MVKLEISYNITKKEKIAIRFISLYYLNKLKDVYYLYMDLKAKKEWKTHQPRKINVKISTYYSYFQKSRKIIAMHVFRRMIWIC